jgi:hypothetical protein
MAVVSCSEVIAGTSASGKYGESIRLTRKWTVRVDNPSTNKGLIVGANGVSWGDPHPDLAACRAMEFEASNSDDVGMRWMVTVTYYVPPPAKKVSETGVPSDYWEASGGTRTVPCFEDVSVPPETITNSAGDPLEGLEREESEFGWSLTKFYTDDSWMEDAVAASNTVNDGDWSGCPAKTWKVEFKGAKLREISPTNGEDELIVCVETHWDFRYQAATWKSKPWDVGFMELVGSGERRAITGSDGKAVKQPVALDGSGGAKAPGEKPDVINGGEGVDIYAETDFGTLFGSPYIFPS